MLGTVRTPSVILRYEQALSDFQLAKVTDVGHLLIAIFLLSQRQSQTVERLAACD